jgi:cAMP-specific phosphodiesterase 4
MEFFDQGDKERA